MPAPYPGLRRRRGQQTVLPRGNENDAFGNIMSQQQQQQQQQQDRETRRQRRARRQRRQQQASYQTKLSSLYFILSFCLALLAIITASSSSSLSASSATQSVSESKDIIQQQRESIAPITEKLFGNLDSLDTSPSDYFFKSLRVLFSSEDKKSQQEEQKQQQRSVPPLFRWMLPPVHNKEQQPGRESLGTTSKNPLVAFLYNVVDPSLLHPQPSTPTDIIDKILTSTPRLLAIANLLVAFTWLLHYSVANWFLGPNAFSILRQESNRHSWAGRERLGGFLVFKLLLISAVVAPDTLDLLILLSWYTLLSFFKSLVHLCAATIAHCASSGLPPQRGVLRLLVVVLFSDILSASVCVALFHGAGWGMVVLLTCDCALLFVDVLVHALEHASQVLEDSHSTTVRELEERQVDIHTTLNQARDSEDDDDDVASGVDRMEELREESRLLDRRVEFLETAQARRIRVLDSLVFGFQLLAYALTVAHFCHIWFLHGLQFTLVDGVLALHLHSALTAAGKKIAERRNLNRIARDLDNLFEDATEMDMRKAGDVCCICLVTMTTGNVKRVGCGHLYHTTCLREVVERARSIEAAKCPLCRASVLDGRHSDGSEGGNGGGANNNNGDGDNANNTNAGQQQARGGLGGDAVAVAPPQPQQQGAGAAANAPPPGEHALFRFSTENILPAWLPLPAFSFEVVRRPPVAFEAAANDAAQQQGNGNRNNNDTPRPSFFRRLLIMAGAIPMSSEETAMYLDQLVDMFPQYDRADLLRELRMRGSSEAVVEAVLMGVFSGAPRGEVVAPGVRNQALPNVQPRQVANVIDEGNDSDFGDDEEDRQ